MRDAAGELPQSFHFVGLPNLLLEIPPDRDVLGDARQAIDLARRVCDWKSAIIHPAHGTIGPQDAVFDFVGLDALPCDRRFDSLAIRRVNGIQPRTWLLAHLFARSSPDSCVARTHINNSARGEIREPE